MRLKKEAVLCFESSDNGLPKVVREYRKRYRSTRQAARIASISGRSNGCTWPNTNLVDDHREVKRRRIMTNSRGNMRRAMP
jgi:hypothetical protein